MTNHLTPDECFQAADGSLATARLDHVSSCEACLAAVSDARAWVARIGAVDVPEPSPLFWDHFSARVRAATAAEPLGEPAAWWSPFVRAGFALGTTAAVAMLAVWLVRVPGAPAREGLVSVAPATESAGQSWESVKAMTSGLSSEELDGLVPSDDDGSLFIEELSAAERAAFARLLQEQLAVVR